MYHKRELCYKGELLKHSWMAPFTAVYVAFSTMTLFKGTGQQGNAVCANNGETLLCVCQGLLLEACNSIELSHDDLHIFAYQAFMNTGSESYHNENHTSCLPLVAFHTHNAQSPPVSVFTESHNSMKNRWWAWPNDSQTGCLSQANRQPLVH